MSTIQDSPSRNYVFTLNNYTDSEVAHVASFAAEHCGYLVYGCELGDSNTPHLQGYLQLVNKNRITWLKKRLSKRAHFEVARGTPDEASSYCKKDLKFVEFGTLVRAGQRRDLEVLAKEVAGGKSMLEVSQSDPVHFVRYHKGLTALANTLITPRDWKTQVIWYWGPTGSGKSRLAKELTTTKTTRAYWKNPTNKWWDGYEGQADVIIDDYRRDLCTFADLLRLFDRYPMNVEVKGGTTEFRSYRIFITSPKSPEDTWTGRTEEDLAQLMRRIDEVKYFPSLEPNGGGVPIKDYPTTICTFHLPTDLLT